jgi:hypothetical protein
MHPRNLGSVLKLIAIGSTVAFAGCASRVVSSSERSVVVNAGSMNIAEAQALATSECRQHGRKARLVRLPRDDRTFVFDCDL